MDRDQVQDMIAASEARTDTKFAQLEGKLDLLIEETRHTRTETAQELSYVRERLTEGREDQRSTRNTVLATVIPSALGLAVLILALWQWNHDPPPARQQPPAASTMYNQMQPQPAPPKALPAPAQNKG